ncbi:MAG: hypothetical protein NTY11_01790 [Candidatus Parcubacteria bacterium]|nr:hypothetical protein [Candidatus Parcubacteria bacterium]
MRSVKPEGATTKPKKERVGFGKAMLRGIVAAVIVYCIVQVLQTITGLWEPVLQTIGIHNIVLKWLASLGLSIGVIAPVGYAISILHPFKGIIYKILGIKAKEAKSIVFVRVGGVWFYGWLTGRVLVEGRVLYKITIPSAPLPMTGNLVLAPRKRVIFVDVTMAEHLAQLISMGLNALREAIGVRPTPCFEGDPVDD